MTKYKVAELDGALLDAAVAKAEGLVLRCRDGLWRAKGTRRVPWYSVPLYSTDWAAGGPIIESRRISLMARRGWFHAQVGPEEPENATQQTDERPLYAAMRALVVGKFGDEVELP